MANVKKMKIIKNNRNKADCGVVAAFNIASWCNIEKKYEEIEKIALSCGYQRKKGMYVFQFSNLMKKLGLPAKKIKAKSLEHIENKLYLGKLFILIYTPTGYNTGHATSIFMDHKGKIRLINPDSERTTWDELVSDIHTNGMRSFSVYEIPCRKIT